MHNTQREKKKTACYKRISMIFFNILYFLAGAASAVIKGFYFILPYFTRKSSSRRVKFCFTTMV